MTKVQKIVKYGNSLAVVLPSEIAEAKGFEPGTLVNIEVVDGIVQIRGVEIVPSLSDADEKFARELFSKRKKAFKELAKS